MLPPGTRSSVSEDGQRAASATGISSSSRTKRLDEAEWAERSARLRRRRHAPAGERRAGRQLPVGRDGLGVDRGRRGAEVPRLMTFTGGFDLTSVDRPRARLRRARRRRGGREPFRTEHYEMVMHAGDMAWVLPELVWHLEDLRVGMSYQNYYIARLASKFVKVALGRSGWRRALRRLSRGATSSSRTLDDPRGFDRAYYDYWSRLVPDDAKGRVLLAGRAGRRRATARPSSVYREVLAARRDLDPLDEGALLRGQDVSARPAGRRGQGLDGAQPRGAGPVPRQRARRRSPSGSRRG